MRSKAFPMKRIATLMGMASLLFTTAVTGCAADDATSVDEASNADEIRAEAVTYSHKSPMASAALEDLRQATDSDFGDFLWTANQYSVSAVRLEGASGLTGENAAAVVRRLTQRAFAFDRNADRRRSLVQHLRVVTESADELTAALDGTGLVPTMNDEDSSREHARLVTLLRRAAKEDGVVVLRGELTFQPDMYWEGLLAVFDTKNGEVLFVRGGYGT